ncbi:MAG: hypothetical protein OXG44_16715 [Gammaproteobacteria bacterium]|nr:hypothetical protein [Gammaproteobacteria bacterium]
MSTFSLGEISSKLGAQMRAEQDKLGDMMANFDPDDPGAALQMEMEIQRYKAEVSLQAALVKVVGDMDQMIFQKM